MIGIMPHKPRKVVLGQLLDGGRIAILVGQPPAVPDRLSRVKVGSPAVAGGCPTKQLVSFAPTSYRADHATPSGSVPIGMVLRIFREVTSMKVNSFAFAFVINAWRPSEEM